MTARLSEITERLRLRRDSERAGTLAALAHYNVAGLVLSRGQRDLAQHHLRLALRENPQLESARDLLLTLQQPTTASAR